MKRVLTKQEKERLKADIENYRFWKGGKSDVSHEATLQKQVATYLDYTKHVWAHIPNEAKRSHALAQSLKAQGMKAGVPDVLIFDRLLAIELKANSNKPSQSQISWLKALSDCGWRVAWVNSFNEFKAFLNADL